MRSYWAGGGGGEAERKGAQKGRQGASPSEERSVKML